MLVVRTVSDPKSLIGALREQIRAVNADVPVYDVATMSELVAASLERRRFAVTLLALFSVLALFLACIGLYGEIAYLVAHRTYEIGIRMALGAQRGSVLMIVIGEGVKLALIGISVGVAGALLLTRFLSSLFFGVHPTDPLTFGSVIVVLLGVALSACYIPARRATKINPMVVLRHE